MKNQILVLSREVYQLYWNNKLQFITPDKNRVTQYIKESLNFGTTLDRFCIKSNYCINYNLTEFLNN